MGGAAKNIGNVVGTGLSLGLNKIGGPDNPFRRWGNFAGSVVTGGTSKQGWGATRTDANGNPIDGGNNAAALNPGFGFDPNQSANDQGAINALGQSQYDTTLKGISDIGTANTKRAKDLFGEMLPDIAENSQTAHLYDSTGYGQEVARQQAEIASQVAAGEAQQKQAALGGLQGFQTGALQRGMGLEDFINQANVAKSIGAQMAPQAPSSKATGMSGAASGAAAGTAAMPGWGTAIGAGLGYLGGSQANQKGGK